MEASENILEPPPDLATLRVALVHDFLYTYAGAERVLEEILDIVPQADIFSLFDFVPPEQRRFLRGKQVRTSFLQNMPLVKQKHRLFLPLMPLAIENLDVSNYDLVISSSYVAAKGVLTAPHQLHVCYCHSPARFAWDQQHQYLKQSGLNTGPLSYIARAILHYIRGWDSRSANNVDVFISNSQFVRQRIEKFYRRDATTIYPPVDIHRFSLCAEKENYYVTASRLVPYKRVDLIVEAFTRMPQRRLVVIGDGPEIAKLRRIASARGGNIEILGRQTHEVLSRHLQRARGFVFAAEEDFGIAPVEAQSCGTPVIAYGRGGATESIISGKTGLFFNEQTAGSMMEAVDRFERLSWDATLIRSHSENFGRDVFRRSFRREVATAWSLFQSRRGQTHGESARLRDARRREPTPRTPGSLISKDYLD